VAIVRSKKTFVRYAGHYLLFIDPTPSLLQSTQGASSTSSVSIDKFIELQTIFLSMNRPIDGLEWPSFHQKRLSLSTPGITFSLLTQPSLLQRTQGASSTSSPRTDIWLSFNTIFLCMNRPIDGLEWPLFDQKRLSLSTPGITFSLLT
jgi:hypothetical protein